MDGFKPVNSGRSLSIFPRWLTIREFEVVFHFDNINKIPMLVQQLSRKLKFKQIMMRMGQVLCAPVSSDQGVLGIKFTSDSKCVHGLSSVRIYGQVEADASRGDRFHARWAWRKCTESRRVQ